MKPAEATNPLSTTASSSLSQVIDASPSDSASAVYHEKQSRWRCGLHAVNALLHRKAFTPADFDQIADSLLAEREKSWSHPHRSVFGMGDYDVNVLLVALERNGLSSRWINEKDDLQSILENDNLSGILVNVVVKDLINRVLSFITENARHWVAIPRYSDSFFLVDSKANSPIKFGSKSALLGYLEKVRKEVGHILAIERVEAEPGN